jgi:phage baseplate assembly protein W
MALKPSRSYKDLSFTMSSNPITGDLVILKDDNAIKRSLLNLFSYRRGEKFFNSSFGSGIPDLLFEPFDFATAGLIEEQVRSLINLYEPRVNLLDIVINLNEDEYLYEIQIDYTIPDSSPQLNTVTLSLASSSKI